MTPCSEELALEILRDPSVLRCLSIYPQGIKSAEAYLVGGALLIVMPGGDQAEVHIACRYRDRVGLSEKLKEARETLRQRGFRRVWTTAPESRTALVAMLKNLGFKKSEQRWVWE